MEANEVRSPTLFLLLFHDFLQYVKIVIVRRHVFCRNDVTRFVLIFVAGRSFKFEQHEQFFGSSDSVHVTCEMKDHSNCKKLRSWICKIQCYELSTEQMDHGIRNVHDVELILASFDRRSVVVIGNRVGRKNGFFPDMRSDGDQ